MDAEEVFKVLSHPLRLEVLRLLSVDEGTRYTDVLEELGVETGKLNFHLRKLDGFVESREDGYVLTRRGVEALRVGRPRRPLRPHPPRSRSGPGPSSPGPGSGPSPWTPRSSCWHRWRRRSSPCSRSRCSSPSTAPCSTSRRG